MVDHVITGVRSAIVVRTFEGHQSDVEAALVTRRLQRQKRVTRNSTFTF